MIAEFITATDQRWPEFLREVLHDFYHLPEYVAFAARHEGGAPAAFMARDESSGMLIPLLLRMIPETLGAPAGWCDATSPYGYPSPLFHPATKSRQAERFLHAFIRCSRELEIVTVFLRFHPLIPSALREFSEHGTVIHHGRTVFIDLTADRAKLWSNTSDNHRRGITKLRRCGFQARIDNMSDWQGFVAAYGETMERLCAHSFYRFSEAYFSELKAALGERLHLCAVVSPENEVAAAGLFASVDGIVQYHLGGTAGKYLGYAPSKMMFDHVREWAKDTGHRYFHLGGGLGGRDDSLFGFKSGFSKLTADFHTCRLVMHHARYACLSNRFQQSNIGERLVNDEYFPLYRG